MSTISLSFRTTNFWFLSRPRISEDKTILRPFSLSQIIPKQITRFKCQTGPQKKKKGIFLPVEFSWFQYLRLTTPIKQGRPRAFESSCFSRTERETKESRERWGCVWWKGTIRQMKMKSRKHSAAFAVISKTEINFRKEVKENDNVRKWR